MWRFPSWRRRLGAVSRSEAEGQFRGDSGGPERTASEAGGFPRTIRVVIVDDHVLVREGTVELLEQLADVEVVGQAGTADEGVTTIEAFRPDVAIVDVNLPDRSGLEVARVVRETAPSVRILIVSAYDEYAYVTEALELGVGGYLLKHATGKELVDAVCAVANGVFVLDRAISGRLARRWRNNLGEGRALTDRETTVLSLLARGRSDKEIASELGVGVRTTEGLVAGVLGKLGVATRTEAVAYALGHRLVPPEADGDRDLRD